MNKNIEFFKASASGNDFIIIDRFRLRTAASRAANNRLAKALCRRKLSVGADGLLLIEPSRICDFKMRIFNPDGKEAEMCGNGSLCAALYALKQKVCGRQMKIETRAGILEARVSRELVKIKFSRPKDLRLNFDLSVGGRRQNLNYINTGVPHTVCFVKDLDKIRVAESGKQMRYHPEFQPTGANADFVQVISRARIRLRTYERGVEEETLSCGTGAVAAAIITVYEMQNNPRGKFKVKVDTRSGQALNVYFEIAGEKIAQVYLEGPAQIIYRGRIE